MKYCCDISDERIPEGQNVLIDIKPVDDTAFIDISEERKDLRMTLMVHEDIARLLIRLIWCKEMNTVLAVWPPDKNGVLTGLQTPFESACPTIKPGLDELKDHKGHRWPVANCEICEYEELTENLKEEVQK